jgi:hypothetical protein
LQNFWQLLKLVHEEAMDPLGRLDLNIPARLNHYILEHNMNGFTAMRKPTCGFEQHVRLTRGLLDRRIASSFAASMIWRSGFNPRGLRKAALPNGVPAEGPSIIQGSIA